MHYRRANTKGGTYFFTVNLHDRKSTLLVDEIDLLRTAFYRVKKQHPFIVNAIVVLPEHIHAIMTLPANDSDFAKRWSLIKAGFSRQLPKFEKISHSRAQKGERGIWQRRYWEHLVRDDVDLKRHIDYIHYNPVKHGHVPSPVDWPYSSLHGFIDKGIVDKSWGHNIVFDGNLKFGE